MSVRIRFKRVGRPHAPFFRLVAIDRQDARDAEPIEVLGTFSPHDKKNPYSIKVERIKYWVSVGALPTESVLFTLKKAGLWSQINPAASKSGATASAKA